MSAEMADMRAAGPATGLFKSLLNLAANLITIAQTRLQLLTTELREEVHRAASMVIWAFVALSAGFFAIFLGMLTIIFAFWDTHRILAAVSVTALFVVVAVIAGVTFWIKLRNQPALLEATIAELGMDQEQLRARLNESQH
jgi:uncharacterized membrane protein YqjE